MLARIRDSFFQRALNVAAVALAGAALASCAAKKEPVQLVSDPAATRESSLPWNQQEKWEGQGQFGGMADRMQGARGR
jgi:hypothetical protein